MNLKPIAWKVNIDVLQHKLVMSASDVRWETRKRRHDDELLRRMSDYSGGTNKASSDTSNGSMTADYERAQLLRENLEVL